MATVYKRGGSGSYYVTWTNHKGKRQTKSSGTTCKATATRIANKLEDEAAQRREGLIDVEREDIEAIAAMPLKVHLDDYGAAMASKSKQGHIDDTRIAIEKFGFESLKDITADKVNKYASELRKAGRAARTIASHLQSIKGFTRWAVKNGKLLSDPLATVSKPSVEDDRRLVRRFLSHDEWQWLDTTTRNSPERFGMTGMARALLYATAIQTGLRSSELRSLTRGKLNLTDAVPFVVAKPGGTKNGKLARQYIQPELAMELQNLVGRKLAGATVFQMPKEHDVADMLRADMAAARVDWLNTFQEPQERIERDASDFLRSVDSEGERLDFHGLRHTCASWLIKSGADVKTVQTIMRHSDIRLTMDRYGHLFPGSEAAAIERIRGIFTQPKEQRKTGTAPTAHSTALSIRTDADRCGIVPLATPNHHQDTNEKTPRFPENDEEKAGFSVERLRWELNPRWRICNPQGTNENTGNPDTLQRKLQHLEISERLGQCRHDLQTMIDRSQSEFERSKLAEALADIRNALTQLESL